MCALLCAGCVCVCARAHRLCVCVCVRVYVPYTCHKCALLCVHCCVQAVGCVIFRSHNNRLFNRSLLQKRPIKETIAVWERELGGMLSHRAQLCVRAVALCSLRDLNMWSEYHTAIVSLIGLFCKRDLLKRRLLCDMNSTQLSSL